MITEEQLIEAGFVRQYKQMQGEKLPTDRYVLPGWVPVPYILWEDRNFPPAGQIDAIQRRFRTKEDLDEFLKKMVPTFCDKTSF